MYQVLLTFKSRRLLCKGSMVKHTEPRVFDNLHKGDIENWVLPQLKKGPTTSG